MKEKRQIKGVEERLGSTIPSPTVSPHPAIGYPTGTEYLGYSPASSPAFSPSGVPTIPVTAAASTFSGVPSLPVEAISLYGQIPSALKLSTSPVASHATPLSFLGQHRGPYPGSFPADYQMNPASLGMMPTTPFGHPLMGPAIL